MSALTSGSEMSADAGSSMITSPACHAVVKLSSLQSSCEEHLQVAVRWYVLLCTGKSKLN